MTRLANPPRTLADVLHRLGDVPPDRVCPDPPPGKATERHLLRFLHATDKRLYELVDGTLVEKTVGAKESFLAMEIAYLLKHFNRLAGNPGMVLGPDGTVRLHAGLVRIPDVAFTRWERLPGGRVPDAPLGVVAPDLAVEILSPSNRPGEMRRKLADYFDHGVRVVWYIQPTSQTAQVFVSPTDVTDIPAGGTIDGGDVLPGFRLPLADLFAELAPPRNPGGG
jgi:Uma2 family endonuclease